MNLKHGDARLEAIAAHKCHLLGRILSQPAVPPHSRQP